MAILSESESTISLAQEGAASNDGGQLDSAGQAILKLLHQAADAAETNSRRAFEAAQRLAGRSAVRSVVKLHRQKNLGA